MSRPPQEDGGFIADSDEEEAALNRGDSESHNDSDDGHQSNSGLGPALAEPVSICLFFMESSNP